MHQQLWGYKVEDKLYVGVREQRRLNTTDLIHTQLKALNMIPRDLYSSFIISVQLLKVNCAQIS
jgi:hypothetical protein